MSGFVVGAIGIVATLVLIFARMWVGVALLTVGFVGAVYLGGLDLAFSILGRVPFSSTASYAMASIPMFVLMGAIIQVTGIGADLYVAASKWIGKVRGGLAMATIVASGLFAAVTGSSVAAVVTMGKVAYPEMIKFGYARHLAAATIAAGGTLGILIPPSLGFILYGLITEQSIGKLFMAGIVPGVLLVVFYVGAIAVQVRIRPDLAPVGMRTSVKEKLRVIPNTLPIVIIFVFMLTGLYLGWFTPTAAGAMGAVASLIAGLAMRRLNWKKAHSAFRDAAKTTAMLFLLIVGAYVFMRFMTLSGLPGVLADSITSLYEDYGVPRLAIIVIIVIMYLIIGMFMDFLAALLLTLPIIYPIILALGYDPIWWGVIMVRVMEVAMISPPYGLNLMMLSRTLQVPYASVYKGIWAFLIADCAHIALLIGVPTLGMLLQ